MDFAVTRTEAFQIPSKRKKTFLVKKLYYHGKTEARKKELNDSAEERLLIRYILHLCWISLHVHESLVV